MKNLVLITTLIFLPLIEYSQVSANFEADITQGCNSIVVHFNNLSEPQTGLTYFWDFGNGHTSTMFEPVAAFINPGSYTVKLIVDDGISFDTLIKENYIGVFEKPQADILVNENETGCVPFTAHFIDNSQNGDGNIISRFWDFGDGIISNEQNPTHTYEYQNDFMVSLVVTDENNCTGITVYPNAISAYKPKSDFLAQPRNSCMPEMNVNFFNNSEGIGELNYQWDFGDNTYSEELHPVHTYTTNGNYTVELITTDEHNCSDTLIKNNYITLSGVNSVFTLERDTLCLNEVLQINNFSINAVSYLWDFGDGTTSNVTEPVHSYSQTGNYTITLTANHSLGCSDVSTINVNVEEILADFSLSDEFSCEIPVTIQYANLSQNAVSYEWHFGNGESSIEEEPVLVLTKKGIYIDTLIAYSPHGCISIKVNNPSFTVLLPNAYFTPNTWINPYDIKGCAPLTVNFKNQSVYDTEYDEISGYYWNFGDGNTSTSENPVNVFNEIGVFLVSLYFTTEQGCTSSTYYVQAKTGTIQQADFIKDNPDTICASELVRFFDKSEDSTLINGWYWSFGDGSYSLRKNPTHLYTDTGLMEVTLQSYYNGCGDAETKSDFIYIKGPYADLSYKTECENPYLAQFKSNSIGADSVFWNFGDNTPIDSIHFNPTHLYDDNIIYTTVLTAVNTLNNCSYTSLGKILIKDIRADFKLNKDLGCENLNINLNSKSSQDAYYFTENGKMGTYLWDFGDGTTLFTNSDSIKHVYTQKGTYPLKLKVSDFWGCKDSLIKMVNIFKPEPEFTVNDLTGCMPMSVTFENETESDTTIVAWSWYFGDGTSSDNENPTHIYNEFGIFNVMLNATDALGCLGSLVKESYIRAQRPVPDFTATDRTVCTGETITFIPNDTSGIVTYYWDFGDNTFSNEAFPMHYYKNSGRYTVSLTMVDQQGCDSTISSTDYMFVQTVPVPNFYSVSSLSDCYPFQVNFSDSTNNPEVVDWKWNFGDGQTALHLKNPAHIYTGPGKYDVSLSVYTENGCTSEALKQEFVYIKGPYAEINAPDTICRNQEAVFIAENQQDIFELQWIFGDGSTSSLDTAIHAYDYIGYVFPVLLLKSDDFGTCDIYIQDSLYIPELIPEILVDQNLINGCIPFEFNASNTCSDADYFFWNFDDGTFAYTDFISHNYLSPGNYHVKLIISNEYGCSDSSTIDVEAFALPQVDALNDTLICRGNEIQLVAYGAEHYQWFPNMYLDDENADQPVSLPDSTISYTVLGTDTNSCVNTSNVKITVQQQPVVNLIDTAVIIGEQVILDAYSNDIMNWQWSPDYELSCMNCPVVTVTPLEPTWYEIAVTDTSNCFTLTYDVFIDILKEYSLDVPTAFTPNGDGINDVLFVRGWGIDELIVFKIANRYGEIVFETNDKNIGWDGSFKGKIQGIETYTYFVSVKTYENQILSKKGSVKLLK
jgi:gliding motility-associated-like protein